MNPDAVAAGRDPSAPELSRRDLLKVMAAAAVLPGELVTKVSSSLVAVEGSPGAELMHYDSLTQVARLIGAGELSPVELTTHMLDRIAAVDGGLHSYVTVMAETALDSAREAEDEIRAGRYRGPLHGVPIGVKDLCFTRGTPTAAGTKVFSNFVPEFDATVVARLRAAGAVILGKLTLCEGAMGPYHPELKIPVNPWDATRWSGVSSSGSGVATAAGLCFASIGTDTGGSIRYPAAANGCVGLKPTYGRVSRHGVFPLAESMDHVGPMARTVEDAAIMFDAIAGFDPNDPTSLAEPASPVRSELSSGVAGFRIGFDRRYATEGLDPDLGRAMDAVLESLASAGADIVDITMPDVGGVGPAWRDLSTAEAAAFHAETYPSRSEDYGSGFRAVLDHGLGVSGVDYANAARFRAEFAGRMNRLLGTVDCMVCPSFGGAAPRIGAQGGVRDSFTKPFNFSGSPTLSMPCGFSPDGLPYSVQFVGRPLSEAVLCRVGYTFERATEWHLRHPPI